MRVLVVDDDPFVRRGTRRMLPRFAVDEAACATDALAVVENGSYDALVVDVCLGDQGDRSGAHLVKTLRERGWTLAVILASGVETDLDSLAKEMGADATLLKGDFEGSTLRTLLERLVGEEGPVDVKGLSPELRQLVSDALDFQAEALTIDAHLIYRLALIAREALAQGGAAIETCARAVGLTRRGLQPFAIISARWISAELRHLLLERRTARGHPITMSHLLELSRLPRGPREKWTERFFAEDLTVRELHAWIVGEN